jgi:hypothetical protein
VIPPPEVIAVYERQAAPLDDQIRILEDQSRFCARSGNLADATGALGRRQLGRSAFAGKSDGAAKNGHAIRRDPRRGTAPAICARCAPRGRLGERRF